MPSKAALLVSICDNGVTREASKKRDASGSFFFLKYLSQLRLIKLQRLPRLDITLCYFINNPQRCTSKKSVSTYEHCYL